MRLALHSAHLPTHGTHGRGNRGAWPMAALGPNDSTNLDEALCFPGSKSYNAAGKKISFMYRHRCSTLICSGHIVHPHAHTAPCLCFHRCTQPREGAKSKRLLATRARLPELSASQSNGMRCCEGERGCSEGFGVLLSSGCLVDPWVVLHDVKVFLHEELCGGGTKLSSENFRPDFSGHVGYTLDTYGADSPEPYSGRVGPPLSLMAGTSPVPQLGQGRALEIKGPNL